MSPKEGKTKIKHTLEKSDHFSFYCCIKCNQSCYTSLDQYELTFGEVQSVSGRCVSIDGDIMLVTKKEWSLIIEDYPCEITDEDFVVKEIIE